MVLTMLAVSACAGRDTVVPQPQATPYEGPLRVEPTRPPTATDPDRGGAAGLAVRCRAEPTGRNRFTDKHDGEVFATAQAALRDNLRSGAFKGELGEYRTAAETRERVLYTYEPEDVTVHALVAHHGDSVDGNTGWYIESFASCDPAEFPESVTRGTGLQIWTDSSGRRALTTEIVSYVGADHCNWQHLTFLQFGDSGEAPPEFAYVAGVRPDLDEYFDEPYREHLTLPDDAIDTGYQLGGDHLWLSPDGRRAYVGSRSQIDLWPRTNKPVYCL